MLTFLKNHPFEVEAFFESSIVLTFAIPKEQIHFFLPPCLELDTYKNDWGFIAIAMVQTRNLKPRNIPNIFNQDFSLIGYRIFVKYINNAGKHLRGLYILKSETDKKKMQILGNIFTQYGYTTTDIQRIKENGSLEISSVKSGFKVSLETEDKNMKLPNNSPFTDWKEARRFAGPLPFTFTYNQNNNTVLIVEGVRENWTPRPILVNSYSFSFLDKMNLREARLANAFIIENVPYHWKKGTLELWKPL